MAFLTKFTTYENPVMLFGLCNTPGVFPQWINQTHMEYINMCCTVYLNDILLYSNNLHQHRQDVRNILEAIPISGMKVKPSKCEFHKEETEY